MIDGLSDSDIRGILTGVRTIAVVGASPKPDRPSYGVMRFLQSKGFRCLPVNPQAAGQEILGMPCVATLEDIAEPIDMVDVFRRPVDVPPVAQAAIASGARVLWLQLGIVHEAAAAEARAAGLIVVQDRCPAIEWPRLGL
jgi:predicted CoA-binding protein